MQGQQLKATRTAAISQFYVGTTCRSVAIACRLQGIDKALPFRRVLLINNSAGIDCLYPFLVDNDERKSPCSSPTRFRVLWPLPVF